MIVKLTELESKTLYGLYFFNRLHPNDVFIPFDSVEGQMGINREIYTRLTENGLAVEYELLRIITDHALNNPLLQQVYNQFASRSESSAYGYVVTPAGSVWLDENGVLQANAEHIERFADMFAVVSPSQ